MYIYLINGGTSIKHREPTKHSSKRHPKTYWGNEGFADRTTHAHTIIVKVSFSLNIPISAIRRVLKRDNNTEVYYLAHNVDDMKLYEVKKEVMQYVNLMENGTTDDSKEDKAR